MQIEVAVLAFPVQVARVGDDAAPGIEHLERVARPGHVFETTVLRRQVKLVAVAVHGGLSLLPEFVGVEPVGGDAHAGALFGRLVRPLRAADVVGVGPVSGTGDVVSCTAGESLAFHAPPSRVGGRVGIARQATRHTLAIGVAHRGAPVVIRLESADHLGPELEIGLVEGVAGGARNVAVASEIVARKIFIAVGVHVADADDVVLEAGVVGGAGGGQVRVGVRGVVGVDHWETVAQGVGDAVHHVGGDAGAHLRWWQSLKVAQAFVVKLAHRVTPFVLAEGTGAAELVQVIDDPADRQVRPVAVRSAVGHGGAIRVGHEHTGAFVPLLGAIGARNQRETGVVGSGANVFHRGPQHAAAAPQRVVVVVQVTKGRHTDLVAVLLEVADRLVVAVRVTQAEVGARVGQCARAVGVTHLHA